MSEGIGLLLAIAILIALFGFLLYLFKEQHPILRLVFIMAILVTGFFIPTAVYQLRTNCELVKNTSDYCTHNQTYEYGNNFTSPDHWDYSSPPVSTGNTVYVFHVHDTVSSCVAATYTQQCFTTTSTAPDTFYQIAWSIFQIVIIYFIFHVLVLIFTPVWEKLKRWGR